MDHNTEPYLTKDQAMAYNFTPAQLLELLRHHLAAMDAVFAHYPSASKLAASAKKKYAACLVLALALEEDMKIQRAHQLESLLSQSNAAKTAKKA